MVERLLSATLRSGATLHPRRARASSWRGCLLPCPQGKLRRAHRTSSLAKLPLRSLGCALAHADLRYRQFVPVLGQAKEGIE